MQPSISNNGRTKVDKSYTIAIAKRLNARLKCLRSDSRWFRHEIRGNKFRFRGGGSRAGANRRIGTTWTATRDPQPRHCPHENAMPRSWKWESDCKFTYPDSEQETNWSWTAENHPTTCLRKDETSEEDNLFRHLAATAALHLKIDIGGRGWKNAEEKVQSSSTSAFFALPKTNLRRWECTFWFSPPFLGCLSLSRWNLGQRVVNDVRRREQPPLPWKKINWCLGRMCS